MKLLVVGAGPTGLVAALELRRLGINADLIEKRKDASGFSRAVGILPKSMELLKPSGATDLITKEAVTIKAARFLWKERHLATVPLEPEAGDERSILGLAQDRTETALANRLEAFGGGVSYNSELTGLEISEDGVSVSVNGKPAGSYDYVIAADGIGSQIRKLLKLDFPGLTVPEQWSIADVSLDQWDYPATFNLCMKPDGKVLVMVPLEPRRIRFVSNTADALAEVPFPLQIAEIHRQGNFHIQVRRMEHFNHGRVLFAGDAAHAHSPVGGRGMNLGIADAADLAARMAAGNPQTYGPDRERAAQYAIDISERGRKFMTNKSNLVRLLARAGIVSMAKIGPLRRYFVSNFLLE